MKSGYDDEALILLELNDSTRTEWTKQTLAFLYNRVIEAYNEHKKKEFIYFFKKAADSGDISAQYMLGLILYKGENIEQDVKEAESYFLRALTHSRNSDFFTSKYNIGILHFNKKEYKIAKSYFLSIAENEPSAYYKLGCLSRDGLGERKNPEQAFHYFSNAARKGHTESQYAVGVCHYYGTGTSVDYQKAFESFESAAKKEFAKAQYSVGLCYYHGEGVDCDHKKAFEAFQKSAAQGNVNALYDLGICYQKGEETPKNLIRAFESFKRAADKGHPKAQYHTGCCYYHGIGVQQNLSESIHYFTLASQQNIDAAEEMLGRINAHKWNVNYLLQACKEQSIMIFNFCIVVVRKCVWEVFIFFYDKAVEGDRKDGRVVLSKDIATERNTNIDTLLIASDQDVTVTLSASSVIANQLIIKEENDTSKRFANSEKTTPSTSALHTDSLEFTKKRKKKHTKATQKIIYPVIASKDNTSLTPKEVYSETSLDIIPAQHVMLLEASSMMSGLFDVEEGTVEDLAENTSTRYSITRTDSIRGHAVSSGNKRRLTFSIIRNCRCYLSIFVNTLRY